MIRSTLFLTTALAVGSTFLAQNGATQPSAPTADMEHPTIGRNSNEFLPAPAVSEEFHGVARPSQYADLPPLTSGTISLVHVAEGQVVRKGDPLVTLDDRVPKARLQAATIEANLTGALRRAEVQLRLAESRLNNIRTVVTTGAGGSFELQIAEGERDQAEAAVQQQRDILKSAGANQNIAAAQLDQFTISAPFDGIITEIHQRAGAVDASQTVISIANLNQLEVELHVDAAKYGKICAGDNVVLNASQPVGRSVQAQVLSVSPVINSASNTFRCLLTINNSAQMPAGFTVYLQNHNPLRNAERGHSDGATAGTRL